MAYFRLVEAGVKILQYIKKVSDVGERIGSLRLKINLTKLEIKGHEPLLNSTVCAEELQNYMYRLEATCFHFPRLIHSQAQI